MQRGFSLGATPKKHRQSMTRQSVPTLREGGELLYRHQSLRSVEERNVAWRHVQQINSHFLKCDQNLFDPRPAPFELLTLLRLPIGPDIRREVGADVQISPGKIQNERTLHNGHFENLQSVVGGKQLWYVEAQNGDHCHFFEPLIHGLRSEE